MRLYRRGLIWGVFGVWAGASMALAAVIDPPVERRLTNLRGGFVDAKIVEVTETHVKVVRLSDDSTHEVALAGLTEADREFAAVVLATGKAPPAPEVAPEPAPAKPFAVAMRELSERDPEKIPEVLASFFDAFEREPADTYVSVLASRVWLAANRVPAEQGTAAWITNRVETLLKRPDLRPGQQEALHRVLLYPKIGRDLTVWRAGLDEFTGRFPASRDLAALELHYARSLKRTDAAAAQAHLEKLAQGANEAVSSAAVKELAAWVKIDEVGPIQSWRFTALDGREVDLAKLRGKVVVVYFWTSGAAASQRGLQMLKALHAKHHADGLEIVGIALDSPRPTADEARVKLTAFLQEQALPWPTYSEFAGMETILLRAQGVTHSGHATVLDKRGNVQPGCLEGPHLEKRVQELLSQ